jgi:hypothetical protein
MPSPSHIRKMIEIAADLSQDERYNVSFLFIKDSKHIEYAKTLSQGRIHPVILEEIT